MEGGYASGKEPMTRQEAEEAYRKIKAALLLSVASVVVIVGLIFYFGGDGWPTYMMVAAIVLLEIVGTPLSLHFIRRDLDERVRASETALGKETLSGA